MTTQPPRRRAVQARSRETVERILNAASELIAERGADGATMTEIAQRAGVAMGSLYQYFPDKAGVMAALFERHAALVREMLAAATAGAKRLDDLIARIGAVAQAYFDLHRDDPVVRSLWAAVQTDPDLQALDVADSLANARMLFDVARPLYARVDETRLMAACTICMHLAATAARLALAIPAPLGAATPEVFSGMVSGYFLALAEREAGGEKKAAPESAASS
ncbi:TetR/AcrR family transcriptional regulator [Phenylobacterium montanum]|uniref:TetR/AcrR family transcriptional regulator n=1 Tax=Phenylobacterium montanum TaxID=2823693 RepID=A0A975G2R6_9CAUL|nr:TetR/AcrR family transcriptional regulator [Caulobacter sp. S6]QUD89631.1 TetR/AcrR family transcriptional regulator [Caulobacter sp. S6]